MQHAAQRVEDPRWGGDEVASVQSNDCGIGLRRDSTEYVEQARLADSRRSVQVEHRERRFVGCQRSSEQLDLGRPPDEAAPRDVSTSPSVLTDRVSAMPAP